MADTDRLGPHSIEAEEAVLGGILIDPASYEMVASYLQPADFYELKNAWIYETIGMMKKRGMAVDNITLAETIRNRKTSDGSNMLEAIGGHAYITYLVNSCATALYAETYARIIEAAGVRRRILKSAGAIAQVARDGESLVEDIIAESNKLLTRACARIQDKPVMTLANAASAYWDKLEMLAQGDTALGLPSGYPELDNLIMCLERGNLYLIAARPRVGKTMFMLNIARLIAQRQERPRVLFVSIEMTLDQLTNRLMAAESGIPSERLRSGQLAPQDWDKSLDAIAHFNSWQFYIEDAGNLTATKLRNLCLQHQREHGLDVVFVDYLQLMRGETRHKGDDGNRVQEVSEISRSLKLLARELNVPMVAASQLSRAIENRADKRPQLSDLRESGSLEQDADVVIFLYREELYDKHSAHKNQIDLIVDKNRHGQQGTVTMYWRGNTQTVIPKQNTTVSYVKDGR